MDADRDAAHRLSEIRRQQDLHSVQIGRVIVPGILALQVGIDRYLGDPSSGHRREQIQGHGPALAADELQSIRADGHVHLNSSLNTESDPSGSIPDGNTVLMHRRVNGCIASGDFGSGVTYVPV